MYTIFRLTLMFVVVVLTGAASTTMVDYADRHWLWGVYDEYHIYANVVLVSPIVFIGLCSVYGLFKGRNGSCGGEGDGDGGV